MLICMMQMFLPVLFSLPVVGVVLYVCMRVVSVGVVVWYMYTSITLHMCWLGYDSASPTRQSSGNCVSHLTGCCD